MTIYTNLYTPSLNYFPFNIIKLVFICEFLDLLF